MTTKPLKNHVASSSSPEATGLRPRVAAAVGLALLLASGGGYQWLSGRYARAAQSIPIPAGTLKQLPVRIGDWTGRDVPLDARVIKATDTDDHVNRVYVRSGAREKVNLWVAYGVRFRDLMPHRPEVCYPGSGWTFQEKQELTLDTPDGTPLVCRLLTFTRGGLRNDRITVLNYYILDGNYRPDVAALRERTWKIQPDLEYVAQVQVTCSESAYQSDATGSVKRFAAESAGPIRDLLSRAVSGSKERTQSAVAAAKSDSSGGG